MKMKARLTCNMTVGREVIPAGAEVEIEECSCGGEEWAHYGAGAVFLVDPGDFEEIKN
jgi:hypothetical protein